MVSTEQNAGNLRTASRNAAGRLGLDLTAKQDWTLDERNEYNAELAREILKYPASFTDQTVATAQNTLNHPVGGEVDASLSISDFASEMAAESKPEFSKLLLVAIVATLAFTILPGTLARAFSDAK